MAHPPAVYYVAERMTHGTWNLLLIGLHPYRQRRGIGAAVMRHVETELAATGERILVVETAILRTFESTRVLSPHRLGRRRTCPLLLRDRQ